MKRSSTPSFTAERRIYMEQWQEDAINKDMDQGNRIYNNGVRHYRPLAQEANEDAWLQEILARVPSFSKDGGIALYDFCGQKIIRF